MNVYDFDKTIYKYDSSLRFYFFSIKHNPLILFLIPYQTLGYILFVFKFISKTKFKEIFFSFLSYQKNTAFLVKKFWDIEEKNINDWYFVKHKSSDIIISASPYFLIKEMCDRLLIKNVIASDVNINNGSFLTLNCYGKEKVNRLYKLFPNIKIDEFYSDSDSDIYIAKLSKKAYKVVKNSIYEWNINEQHITNTF